MKEQSNEDNISEVGLSEPSDILPSDQARYPTDEEIINWELELKNEVGRIAESIGIPREKIESLSEEQMNIVCRLHEEGDREAVQNIITDPGLDLLMRTAARFLK